MATKKLIGSDRNQVSYNRDLGTMAFQDTKAIASTGILGFAPGTGVGSANTQTVSRTSTVTVNASCGQITMYSAAGSATAATFTVNNNQVASVDTIRLNQQSGTNLYVLLVTAVGTGSFNITFYTTGGTATDAPVINFSVIKGSIS